MKTYDEIDTLFPDDDDTKKKKSKRKKLLSQLEEVESSYDYDSESTSPSFLPSSLLKDPKKEEPEDDMDDNDWLNVLVNMKGRKPKGRRRKSDDLFVPFGEGKKKKKKKKKGEKELVDYNKEFETELNLYKNLLQDQSKFTDSLQKEYDSIKAVKSSSRGINKTMSDLIENINSARSLSMQLVEKNVNTKKLIAELTMKQNKEAGLLNDGEDMGAFASTYLKQMLNERQAIMGNGNGDSSITDFNDDDDMFDLLEENLGETDRASEVEKYLKYENRNVTIYASIDSDDVENYDFVAKDEEGEIIDDYPLPIHTQLSINRSTNIATDTYGKKYQIIWR